jgi:hypothetical protein
MTDYDIIYLVYDIIPLIIVYIIYDIIDMNYDIIVFFL